MNESNNKSKIGRKENTFGEVWISKEDFLPPSYHQDVILFEWFHHLFWNYSMMNIRWFNTPGCWIYKLWKG